MSMEVSRLAIEVKSTGIDEARKSLDGGNGRGGLYGAADKAEKAVVKLTDSMGKLMQVNASGTATAWNQSLSQLKGTLATLSSSVLSVTDALNKLAPAMKKAGEVTDSASEANKRKSHSGGVVVNTLKAMTTAATAYTAVNIALSIVKQADSWQMMSARLENATGSLNNAKAAQQQMFDLSQRLRVPLDESVKLYTRLAPAIQRSGKSSEYAKDMVEGIATALQLGGANGAEASSVMLQLSQSFSSGVLNGAEFNAVAENGSVLMRALEKSTGKSTAELKKLGSQGKLSMEDVGKAIQQNLPMWREQFDRLPLTFEGGMQRLKNAWTKAIGEMGQDTEFNKQLSGALRIVENMIPAIAQGLGNAFISVMKWIDRNKEVLSQIGGQVLGLIGDVLRLGASVLSITGAVVGAGEEFSVWGFLIFTARMALAAIVDITKVVAQAFAHVGIFIGQWLVYPIYKALEAVEWLLDGFKKLVQWSATGLRAIGKGETADRLEEQAAKLGAWSEKVGGWAKGIDKFFTDASSSVKGWTKDLEEGNGELDKLLRGDDLEKKITSRSKSTMDENAWRNNNPAKSGKALDPKVQSALDTAAKHYDDSLAHLRATLQEQATLIERLDAKGLDYDKVGPQARKLLELQEKLVALKSEKGKDDAAEAARKANIGYTESLIALQKSAVVYESLIERTQERLKIEKEFQSAQETTNKNLAEEATKLEDQVAAYGKVKGTVQEMELAAAKARLLAMDSISDGQRTEATEKLVALLREEVIQRQRIADASSKLGQLDSVKEFDKLFDNRKAEKFASSLTEGFGKAGKAMGLLANAADKYLARQAKIQQGRTILDKLDKNSSEYARVSMKLAEEEAESRIASYADMAGAAKSFFAEGSKGYKAMEAAEKTFRLFQMGMQLKSFLQESGFLSAITSLFVASKTTEIAATEATVGPTIAANTAKQGSNAVTALTSALAAPWPANIGAFAMVAAMLAAIGVAVSGGKGGANISKQRQDAQGTGTVFGNDTAKSESISKSLEILSKNSDISLRYSSGMLSSLQNIEYSLTGATSGVIRTGGAVTGKGFENSSSMFGGIGGTLGATVLGGVLGPLTALAAKLPVIGGLVSKVVGSLFGSSTTLKDAGLMGSNQSVANILQNGFNVQAFQEVQTKKKAFGITYSNKTSTNTSPVDAAVTREFGNIISGMVDSLTSAAGALGMSGDTVRKKLEAVNIDIGKISLKDLSSEEIQKQLEAVFSAIGDTLAKTALPQVEQFQKAGEGLLETVVRVATGVESANYELDKLGITAVKFTDVVNKTGDVGAEIVRQSILMQESGKGITEIISTLTGTAADIASTYKSLTEVRDSLKLLGLGDDVTRDLLKAAGGLDSLKSALEAYTDKFFSDAEKTAMKSATLSKEFAKLGLAVPASKEAFRSLVETLAASGATGQELAAKVLLLADSFADLKDSTDQLVESARNDLTEAYNRESEALINVRDKFKDFADSLASFKTSLLTGDLSTLDVASKYQVEKSKFEDIVNKARAGDETAIGQFQDAATAFLNASRAMNASGAVYTSDFERVLAETDFIQGLAASKSTVAQQQLDALNKQVDGLIKVNDSVLSVAQAIQNLVALIGGKPDASIMPVGSSQTALQAPVMAQTMAETNAALVSELQAVKAEIAALRADQAAQTAATIAATHESNMMNAEAINDGVADVASKNVYAERAVTKLA